MYYDYLNKMFKEFKKAYGIEDSFENFDKYQNLFVEWVARRREVASNYVSLFKAMNKNDNVHYVMAEFGKGIFDTITIEIKNKTRYQPIVISPFAETIKRSSGIETFTGELVTYDGNVIVKYPNNEDFYHKPNCYPKTNSEIDVFMTQVPYSKEELEPFLRLINSDKTLFIGTYGSVDDKDCKENLNKIENLYYELSDISSKDINFCSETQNDAYLSAIKVSPKQKRKWFKRYR